MTNVLPAILVDTNVLVYAHPPSIRLSTSMPSPATLDVGSSLILSE